MFFTFSVWFIVAAVVVAVAIASFVVFLKMDKRDRQIIDEFVKSSTKAEPESK